MVRRVSTPTTAVGSTSLGPPPLRTLPRLPDCADETHCTCPDFQSLAPEQQAWQHLLEWLPVGWTVAPPRLLPATDAWLVVAYNVRGCLADDSFARWTDRCRLIAIGCLGAYFEGGSDDTCVRAQHRRPD